MGDVIVVTDLTFGDGGKGSLVHFLTELAKARIILRSGGSQARHTILASTGLSHGACQFGSGVLSGARTHLLPTMVIDPHAILEEAKALVELGIPFPLSTMTIDERALVVTPFQGAASRLMELALGDDRITTVGVGVGQAVLDAELLGDRALRAEDFQRPWLRGKIETIRQLQLQKLEATINRSDLPPSAQNEIEILRDRSIVDWTVRECNRLAERASIVTGLYLDSVLRSPGVAIAEHSQGVLIDRFVGFHPYTTKVNSTSSDVLATLKEHMFAGKLTRLCLFRGPYMIRHGKGPFVTEDETLTRLLPDVHNSDHPWQGPWRVGFLDIVALRYAIQASGGASAFDGLVASCMDRLTEMPQWQICESYEYVGPAVDLEEFFVVKDGLIVGIKVRPNTFDQVQLDYQEKLGKLLRYCRPKLTTIINPSGRDNPHLAAWGYLKVIEEKLGIPIVIASFGPTELDKELVPGWEERIRTLH